VPKGLRSATYEALATVPGIKVLPGETTTDGRADIGIQYPGKRVQRTAGGTTYDQWSYVAASAVVDRVMQRP
jgi:hypothetical protein